MSQSPENSQNKAEACSNSYPVKLKKGNIYWWCRCGLSERMPFCDNNHKHTDILPLVIKSTETVEQHWCGCGVSKVMPQCDGCSGCD